MRVGLVSLILETFCATSINGFRAFAMTSESLGNGHPHGPGGLEETSSNSYTVTLAFLVCGDHPHVRSKLPSQTFKLILFES